MKNIFATSDLHIHHANIIKYCNRPFASMEEMDNILIANWNSVVKPEDEVYLLGDFVWTKSEEDLNSITLRLNGSKHLVLGNHDYFPKEVYLEAGFVEVESGFIDVSVYSHQWIMCHYQMSHWNRSHFGTYHLFGHEHWRQQYVPSHQIYSQLMWSERKFNVCVDANQFKPIGLKHIAKILESRDTNFQKKENSQAST